MNRRVFVVNVPTWSDGKPTINLKPAEVFGDIVHILGQGKPPPDPMESVARIEVVLKDYTNNDLIVLVGEMDLIAIATAFAMQATGGKVNFLKWDRIHKNYFLYPANLPQLFEEN